jgi:DNA polymerase/3'-5' exonuclease PolX
MSWSKVIDYLEECKGSAENQYAAAAYTRVINQIKRAELKGRVTKAALEEMKLTDHMKEKIAAFVKAKPVKEVKANPVKGIKEVKKAKLLSELSEITGIGLAKAKELISMGIGSVQQLEEDKYFDTLSIIGKAFVKYKPIDRIGRQTIFEIERAIGRDDVIFVGSYRRGKPDSGDIDVLVRDLHQFHSHLVHIFGIDKVVLYSHGDDKSNFLIKYNGAWLQLDAFKYDDYNKYPMLLYATGSKENNIRLRAAAKKKKYLLNQEGLYDEHGNRIPIRSEQDIYEQLGLKYQEPHER